MSITTTSTAPLTGTWSVDPAHSRVEFQVKHLGIVTVRGAFREFEGTLELGGEAPQAYGTVNAASVDTNEPQRDGHLRSGDFFDVEHFPTITFASTAVTVLAEDRYRVTGDFTIKGVTRPVTLRGEIQGYEQDPWGNERVGLEVTSELSRREWGMTFNQALGSGNVLVSDKVKLLLDISAIKQR